jgi:hypothetical protein
VIELVRIVEQKDLWSYRATQNEEKAIQLEKLILSTKPANVNFQWHPLIAASFMDIPRKPARFRPDFGKNTFYGSFQEETALYETAFYLMKERRHLLISDSGTRTIFFVDANQKNFVDLNEYANCDVIMDKNDYSASHEFIRQQSNLSLIIYPSCRDPQQGNNAAIFNINLLAKNPNWESSIRYIYDYEREQVTWLDYSLTISWSEVN